MPQENTPRLYSIDDAASLLGGISPWTLRKQIEQRRVSVVKLGSRVLITSDEIARICCEGLPSLSARSVQPQAV